MSRRSDDVIRRIPILVNYPSVSEVSVTLCRFIETTVTFEKVVKYKVRTRRTSESQHIQLFKDIVNSVKLNPEANDRVCV